ncbi:MAG: hypothetical protein VZR11_07300 [Succinimonas sp.]|nr:hypothetical protein [Succinimonas sp.]
MNQQSLANLNNSPEDERFFEMAHIAPEESGLPYWVLIFSVGSCRKSSCKAPAIEVKIADDYISVSIDAADPACLSPENLPPSEIAGLADVKRWIVLNYDALIKHWNEELTDKEVLNLIKRI